MHPLPHPLSHAYDFLGRVCTNDSIYARCNCDFNGNCQHGGELCLNTWTTCIHIYIQGGCLLQCFALFCSALQCVALRCTVLQCVAVRCSALQCVAVRCSVLQCVAACCSVPYLPRKYTQKIQTAKMAGNSVEADAALHSAPRLDYVCILIKTWSLSDLHTIFFPWYSKIGKKILLWTSWWFSCSIKMWGVFTIFFVNYFFCIFFEFWAAAVIPKISENYLPKNLNGELDVDLCATFSGTRRVGYTWLYQVSNYMSLIFERVLISAFHIGYTVASAQHETWKILPNFWVS